MHHTRRSGRTSPLLFDPEIERTARRRLSLHRNTMSHHSLPSHHSFHEDLPHIPQPPIPPPQQNPPGPPVQPVQNHGPVAPVQQLQNLPQQYDEGSVHT